MIAAAPRVTWLIDVRGLDHGRLAEAFQHAESVGVNGVYFEIADGSDGSDFGYSPKIIALAKKTCGLGRTVHLRVARPDRHAAAYIDAGAQTVAVPVESGGHLQRTLAAIREAGARPSVAINPGTPLTKLQYVLPFVGAIFVLVAEPGATQIAATTFERIEILKRNVDHQKLRVEIFAAGLKTAEEAHAAIEHGASGIVVGSSNHSDVLERFTAFRQYQPVAP